MTSKTYLAMDVLTAARQRIAVVCDAFPTICVSFSGGKDSTVLLDLVRTEAITRNRQIHVFFLDWEAQYQATIDHALHILADPTFIPHWICLPIATPNESSFHDPLWTAWDPAKRDVWVREMPNDLRIIRNEDCFPFYHFGMTFEAFVPAFNQWFEAQYGPTAFFVGLRTDESLNRYRTIKRTTGRKRWQDTPWTTQVAPQSFNCYPLYDWHVEDIWTYLGSFGVAYNRMYDLMWQSGISLHEMRICEPFSLEARKQLDKYHVLEPETWEKLLRRVGGANFGAMYGDTSAFGSGTPTLPSGMTSWKEYAYLLLASMPAPLRAHYEAKIRVFLGWFQKNKGWTDLKDTTDPKLEAKKLGGSWRMVAKMLLRNDYYATGLSFSATEREHEKLQQLKDRYADL